MGSYERATPPRALAYCSKQFNRSKIKRSSPSLFKETTPQYTNKINIQVVSKITYIEGGVKHTHRGKPAMVREPSHTR